MSRIFDKCVSMIFISFYQRLIRWSCTCAILLKIWGEWWSIWGNKHGWPGWTQNKRHANVSNCHIIGSRVSWRMKKCHGDYRWASEIFHPTYEGNEILLFGLIYFTGNMIYTAISIFQEQILASLYYLTNSGNKLENIRYITISL